MNRVILYSTSGCHLCELAVDIISPLLDKHSLYLDEVDIADSLELVERYGVKIPVLKSSCNSELCWPFDSKQADEFLTNEYSHN